MTTSYPIVLGFVIFLMFGVMAGLVALMYSINDRLRCTKVKIVAYKYPYRCTLLVKHKGPHEYQEVKRNQW